jgi:hypothetical protein
MIRARIDRREFLDRSGRLLLGIVPPGTTAPDRA